MLYSTLAVAALASVATAQQTRTTIAIQVGVNNTNTFSPSNIRANVGDMLQFQFMGGNHTVTQSTFAQPCQPIAMFSPNVTGFHSGFVPAQASLTQGNAAVFNVMVTDTTPIWVYCAQARHCEGGMSMVVNENTADQTKSLTVYRQNAQKATTVVPNSSGTTTSGGSQTSANGTPAAAAGSFLTVPSTASLLAFVAGALFL